jgi:hypothetical protein
MKAEIAKWKQHISSRLLVSEKYGRGRVTEVVLLEVSPAGRLKFKYPSGAEIWEDSDNQTLEEVLPNT